MATKQHRVHAVRSIWYYLLLPWSLTPLVLLVTFSILWVISIRARLSGLLLDFILFSWFFKYCFAMLDALIAGAVELPVMSVEMVNPFNEQRPLALFGLLAFDILIIGNLRLLNLPLAIGVGAALLGLLPAQVALLSLTSSLYKSVAPGALARLIHGWGIDYLWLVLALIACTAALYGLWQIADSVALLAAGSQLAFLTMFAIVGGVVHEHRFALGIDSLTDTERMRDRDAREHAAARGATLEEIYGLVRLKRRAEAWARIEAWLGKYGADERGFAEHAALLEASSRWDDLQVADRLCDRYLDWLLRRGETGLAIEVLEQHLKTSPAYRPSDATQRVRLAELATHAGKRALTRTLKEP